jgi:hypothetical protein
LVALIRFALDEADAFAPAEYLPEHPGFHVQGLFGGNTGGVGRDMLLVLPFLGIVVVDAPVPILLHEGVRHVVQAGIPEGRG